MKDGKQSLQLFPKKRWELCCPNLNEYIINLRQKSPRTSSNHSAGYILFPLGSLSSSWLFWKSNTD